MLNNKVTLFLNHLHHPLRAEIEQLRKDILMADNRLSEGIKWNGPNYSMNGADRITMKIQPPKQIQLVFHRGAKVREQPATPLITDASGLLVWKENDRAIATFKNMAEISAAKTVLIRIVKSWIEATGKREDA